MRLLHFATAALLTLSITACTSQPLTEKQAENTPKTSTKSRGVASELTEMAKVCNDTFLRAKGYCGKNIEMDSQAWNACMKEAKNGFAECCKGATDTEACLIEGL